MQPDLQHLQKLLRKQLLNRNLKPRKRYVFEVFLYKNQIKDSELLSPATTQILNEIQNLSNRNVTSTVQNINKNEDTGSVFKIDKFINIAYNNF